MKNNRKLLKEGTDQGFKLDREEAELKKLEDMAKDISTLDLLEEGYHYEGALQRKMRSFISRDVKEKNDSIRSGIENLVNMGVENQKVIDILSVINKAEVLLEEEKHKESLTRLQLAILPQYLHTLSQRKGLCPFQQKYPWKKSKREHR